MNLSCFRIMALCAGCAVTAGLYCTKQEEIDKANTKIASAKTTWDESAQNVKDGVIRGLLTEAIKNKETELINALTTYTEGKIAENTEDNIKAYTILLDAQIKMLFNLPQEKTTLTENFTKLDIKNAADKAWTVIKKGVDTVLKTSDPKKLADFDVLKVSSGMEEEVIEIIKKAAENGNTKAKTELETIKKAVEEKLKKADEPLLAFTGALSMIK